MDARDCAGGWEEVSKGRRGGRKQAAHIPAPTTSTASTRPYDGNARQTYEQQQSFCAEPSWPASGCDNWRAANAYRLPVPLDHNMPYYQQQQAYPHRCYAQPQQQEPPLHPPHVYSISANQQLPIGSQRVGAWGRMADAVPPPSNLHHQHAHADRNHATSATRATRWADECVLPPPAPAPTHMPPQPTLTVNTSTTSSTTTTSVRTPPAQSPSGLRASAAVFVPRSSPVTCPVDKAASPVAATEERRVEGKGGKPEPLAPPPVFLPKLPEVRMEQAAGEVVHQQQQKKEEEKAIGDVVGVRTENDRGARREAGEKDDHGEGQAQMVGAESSKTNDAEWPAVSSGSSGGVSASPATPGAVRVAPPAKKPSVWGQRSPLIHGGPSVAANSSASASATTAGRIPASQATLAPWGHTATIKSLAGASVAPHAPPPSAPQTTTATTTNSSSSSSTVAGMHPWEPSSSASSIAPPLTATTMPSAPKDDKINLGADSSMGPEGDPSESASTGAGSYDDRSSSGGNQRVGGDGGLVEASASSYSPGLVGASDTQSPSVGSGTPPVASSPGMPSPAQRSTGVLSSPPQKKPMSWSAVARASPPQRPNTGATHTHPSPTTPATTNNNIPDTTQHVLSEDDAFALSSAAQQQSVRDHSSGTYDGSHTSWRDVGGGSETRQAFEHQMSGNDDQGWTTVSTDKRRTGSPSKPPRQQQYYSPETRGGWGSGNNSDGSPQKARRGESMRLQICKPGRPKPKGAKTKASWDFEEEDFEVDDAEVEEFKKLEAIMSAEGVIPGDDNTDPSLMAFTTNLFRSLKLYKPCPLTLVGLQTLQEKEILDEEDVEEVKATNSVCKGNTSGFDSWHAMHAHSRARTDPYHTAVRVYLERTVCRDVASSGGGGGGRARRSESEGGEAGDARSVSPVKKYAPINWEVAFKEVPEQNKTQRPPLIELVGLPLTLSTKPTITEYMKAVLPELAKEESLVVGVWPHFNQRGFSKKAAVEFRSNNKGRAAANVLVKRSGGKWLHPNHDIGYIKSYERLFKRLEP